jgi:hypothetical protein
VTSATWPDRSKGEGCDDDGDGGDDGGNGMAPILPRDRQGRSLRPVWIVDTIHDLVEVRSDTVDGVSDLLG